MNRLASVFVFALLFSVGATEASASSLVYKHCVTWVANDTLCFLELLNSSDSGAHILVAKKDYDRLLTVPWDDTTPLVVEVVDQAEYDRTEQLADRGYDYDLTGTSAEVVGVTAWTVPGTEYVADAAAAEFVVVADAIVGSVIAAVNESERGGLLGVQLEHNDRGRLVGHSPDGSRCAVAILVGAVNGAGSGGRFGAWIGSYLPTPAPGGGAIAGGALGASVGLVVDELLHPSG